MSAVLDVRLTALADAIRARDWDEVEFQYDRVRSTIDRELGVRARPADVLRRNADAGGETPATRTPPTIGGPMNDTTPIDVDALEASKAAAGPRRPAELKPRIITPAEFAEEVNRQFREAHERRRQERARKARRRDRVNDLVTAAIAVGGAAILVVLSIMLGGYH